MHFSACHQIAPNQRMSQSPIELAPDAEDNGLALMMSTLIQQYVEDSAEKRAVLEQTQGRVALISEDGDVATTLHFADGKLVVYGGLYGIPDLTIRGQSDDLVTLGGMPTHPRFHIPDYRDKAVKALFNSLRKGALKIYGLPANLRLFLAIGKLFEATH